MDAGMIWKSFLNVLYLNQAKDLMTASHWEHIYPLEKLSCLILIFCPVIVKDLPWALYIYWKWIKEWLMCDPFVRSTSKCIYNSLLNAPCALFITQIHPPPTTKVFSWILSVGKAVFVWRNHYRWDSRLRTDLPPHLPQHFRHVPASDNYNV